LDTGISSPERETASAVTSELGAPSTRSRWLYILLLVSGLAALVLGPLAGGLFILLSLIGQQVADPLSVTTIGVSVAALGLGFGSALAWTGYQGLRGRPSHPFHPGRGWLWGCLVGLGLVLLFGQIIISFGLLAPVTFPLFHVLAIALPAIVILVLIGRGVRGSVPASTRRQVVGQMALGAFVATAISFTVEAVAVVTEIFIVGAVLALAPGGLAQLNELQAVLSDPARLQDFQVLAHWLLKPWILLPVILLLVIIAPLVEELAKSIGVPLYVLGTGRKPSLAQGWLWGIGVGAGFAITEGLFNGAANIPFWAGIALLRVGTTGMHVITAGLTGVGWARTLASRRPGPFLGSYLVSVTLHSLWNGLTVLVIVSSLWVMIKPEDPLSMAGGGLGGVVGLVGLLLLALTIIGVAVYITLRVRQQ
jgi:RsiW-degrading membrane proteinase PrsW (M82 family)